MPEYQGNRYAIYKEAEFDEREFNGRQSFRAVVQTRQRFALKVHYTDAWYEAYSVAKHPFVTYDPSDLQWLLYAGWARLERFPIVPGVRLNLKRLTGSDVNGIVEQANLELHSDIMSITGEVIDTLVMGGFYVR